MAGLVPAIDVMMPRRSWSFPAPVLVQPCCGSPATRPSPTDMLTRLRLRLKRGPTKNKAVERYLLAKLPNWQVC